MFTIIVAADRTGAIGNKNELLWRLPKDMKHFREYTTGKTILMGAKTALSVGMALPKRTNLVLTTKPDAPYKGQIPLHSLREVLAYHKEDNFREIVVCGGELVYAIMAPWCSKIIVTEVDAEFEEVDARVPLAVLHPFTSRWKLTVSEEHKADDKHQYDFEIKTYTCMAPPWEGV